MRYGSEYCATFAGFVPARNPRLVMIVTFDRVSGARHGGGNVAAPVFGRTMARVLQTLNIAPDFPDQLGK
jgi:cell division protein FtsI (penicillin-binding protein 3)